MISLCNIHEDDSGVVHSGNFQIASWLINEIKDKIPHEIVTHVKEDPELRDDAIKEFVENRGKRPMLLVSPSVTEGLDLIDDTARFAIFVKIPYPFLGDAWVRKRLDLSDEWYQRQAMINIIQGGGRIVRSKEDWGNTYILDTAFEHLWRRYRRNVPPWWKEAFSISEKRKR